MMRYVIGHDHVMQSVPALTVSLIYIHTIVYQIANSVCHEASSCYQENIVPVRFIDIVLS